MDIILFGGIDWTDSRRFPVHHVAERLATEHRVFYIDNFGGVRDLNWGDIRRGLFKMLTAFRRRSYPQPELRSSANVVVRQPIILPTPRFPNTIGRLNGYLVYRSVQSLIEEHGIKRPVVWTRVATHIAWNAIQKINPELLVYQVVDNFPHNPIIPASLRDRHAKHAELFSEAADVIFASARGLKKKKESYGDQVFFFPNGVEVDKFRRPVQAEPEILKDISRPLLGFVGTVAPPVDFATIKKVARRKREWSFVFIGPVTQFARLGDLRKLNNVHFIGPVDHDELPAYLQALDLGLIPYELTEFTEYTFPSKLAEYLSSGIPVLASNLPEMRHYRDVIGIYRNADEFILEAVGQMRQQGERKRQRRLKIADSLSWDHIVNQMMGVVEEQMSSASTQQHSV